MANSPLSSTLRAGTASNVDENPTTAARFNVSSIPTLLVLRAGQEVDRLVGVQPQSEIARRLERLIA